MKKPAYDGCKEGLLSIPIHTSELKGSKIIFTIKVADAFTFEGCKIDGSNVASYVKQSGFVCFGIHAGIPLPKLNELKCVGINVATEMSGGFVELRVNSFNGPLLCICGIECTGSYSFFQTQYFWISNSQHDMEAYSSLDSISALFLVFLDNDVGNFKEIEFCMW